MAKDPLPPVAVVVSFIDRINRGDVEGLGELISDDHQLVVLDEPPLIGRARQTAGPGMLTRGRSRTT